MKKTLAVLLMSLCCLCFAFGQEKDAVSSFTLNFDERMWMLQILPAQGDVNTMRLVEEVRRGLTLSDAEMSAIDFKVEEVNGQPATRWNTEKAAKLPPKTVTFGKATLGLISDRFKELSNTKQLKLGMLPLYEKFVK